MFSTLSKIAQKPKDSTIRITRTVFALILIAVILLGWRVTRPEFGLPEWIKYALFVFPIVGLIRGIIDPGLFRKAIWKWTVFGLGVTMVLISLFVIEDQPLPTVPMNNTTAINVGDIQSSTPLGTSFTLSTDNWFGFFGVILMLVGFFLNSKNLTSKNERYGEKVTKIRV